VNKFKLSSIYFIKIKLNFLIVMKKCLKWKYIKIKLIKNFGINLKSFSKPIYFISLFKLVLMFIIVIIDIN